ncbi:MAG TPA: DUF3108 domain-containing protein [Flavisolibacter sp.]|jgi:hypothetical protein|nr:DUF3108 domain-containing protein [Flavisolibacter sp.]
MSVFKYMLALGFLLTSFRQAEDPCDALRNHTTQNGEQIYFNVYYTVAGVYVNAGSASFINNLETLNGRPVYHVTGAGGSRPSYDWIYKVKDVYETFIDTATMKTLKFLRNVSEGSTKIYENVAFNRSANTAVTQKGVYKVPACVQDVLSSIYQVRNIDFSKYKVNDKIPFTMFLDNQVYDMYVRLLGREDISTKFGTFHTIKFKPLLVEGTIFKGGEQMTVWVSDDANHIPVRIESPIIVGSVKVDMMGYKNLRYPLTGLIKKK